MVEVIRTQKPDVVFAPHVETSAGVILPDDYIAQMAQAAHGGQKQPGAFDPQLSPQRSANSPGDSVGSACQ